MSLPRLLQFPTLLALGLIAAFSVTGCGSDSQGEPVSPLPPDEAPPLAPVGMHVTLQMTGKFVLAWSPNTEPDLAGYRVYLYDPDPARDTAFVLVSGAGLVHSTKLTIGAESGHDYTFRITAVDTSDNESGMSEAFTYTFSPNSTDAPNNQGDDDGERGGGIVSGGGRGDGDSYDQGDVPTRR